MLCRDEHAGPIVRGKSHFRNPLINAEEEEEEEEKVGDTSS